MKTKDFSTKRKGQSKVRRSNYAERLRCPMMLRGLVASLLMLFTLGVGNVCGTVPTTADLDFGTPAVSATFESESVKSTENNTGTAITSSSLTGYGPFTHYYIGKNDHGIQSIAIVDGSLDNDDPMTSKYFAITTSNNGSSVTSAYTNDAGKGAFSFKITKSSKIYIGLYNGDASGQFGHANAAAYLSFDGGSNIKISAGRTSGSPQKWDQVVSNDLPSAEVLDIAVVYNTTASGVTYGGSISLAANSAHVYINGTAADDGAGNAKDFYIGGNTITNFRLFDNSAGDRRTSCVDDIMIYDALPDKAGNTITLNRNNSDESGTTDGAGTIVADATTMTITTAPTRTGYEVAGYYTAASGGILVATAAGALQNNNGNGITVGGNIWTNGSSQWKRGANETFFTYWSAKEYSIILDNESPTSAGSTSVTLTYNSNTHAAISNPSKTGFNFAGWWSEDDGTGTLIIDATGNLQSNTVYTDASGNWTNDGAVTLYAKWSDKTYTDYAFSCAELTLTPKLVTAGTPIFITSSANKTVRSQDSILIVGSGLTPYQALEFPGLNSKFTIKSRANTALSVEEDGTINAVAYIFYTPGEDETTDGLLKITGLTVSVGGTKPKTATLTQDIIGRHLPANFVIAGKKDNKWYALPSNMESTSHPAPVEIAVDDLNNPSIAYTVASNKYGIVGPTNSNISGGNGQYIRFTMSINDGNDPAGPAPLFGTNVNDIGKSGIAKATSDLSAGWWWKLQQENTSITNPQDAKYKIYCANNTSTLSIKDNAGNPEWGLYASGVEELRLIPASDIIYTEAYFVEWGQHGGVVEVDATGIDATSVVAHLGEATSSAITLSQTGTSVKGTATKYNYTVNFGEGIDFAAATSNGALLRLEWKNGEAVKAMTSLVVPKIIASKATMSSLMSGDTQWETEVHVLPGVTLTANAGDFLSKDVVIDHLEIYPGATVKVTKGAQDVGTLKVRTLVLRNGWTRAGVKAYDVARMYVSTDANLAKNANDNVWYSDWYIDYDQYYPIAVPFPVVTSSITYKNTKSTATAGVTIRWYDGERRATHEQQDQDANWVAYTWGSTMPENLEPSKGYAMTAKRPSGKAFSIVRMPMTFTNPWTTLGEHGSITIEAVTTHKDQISVTGWGKGSAAWYAMGWNFVANPYMCTFNGDDNGISGKIEYQDGGSVRYATIPDLEFKDYYQVPIAEANLAPASGFFIQANNLEPQTITFSDSKIVPPSAAPARYMTTDVTIPEQEAYIRLSYEGGKDLMGLIIGEDYTASYEPNADLAKVLGGANAIKTYMHYSNMDMAYVAINTQLAQEWIPVTVQIPADGEYTFSLTNSSIVDALEGVYLIDYANNNKVTNLIENDYVFTGTAGTISNRFAINAIVGKRDTPTGVDALNSGADINSDEPIKFLFHEKVYILYRGIIYDAVGKRVSEIK